MVWCAFPPSLDPCKILLKSPKFLVSKYDGRYWVAGVTGRGGVGGAVGSYFCVLTHTKVFRAGKGRRPFFTSSHILSFLSSGSHEPQHLSLSAVIKFLNDTFRALKLQFLKILPHIKR